MNDFLRKYLLLFFLIANLTAEYYLLTSISRILFYLSLALGLLYSVFNIDRIRNVWKVVPFFLVWILIYIFYQFTSGLVYMNTVNLQYLIAKIVSFSIMAVSISSNPNFYLKTMTKPIGFIIIILLLIGFNHISYSGSRSYGFFNGNASCAVAMYGATCFLFQKKLSTFNKLCLLFCLLCVIMGHSRNALAMLFIIILLRYQLTFSLFIIGLLGVVAVFVVLPYFGLEMESVTRIIGTIDGTVDIDREHNRDIALMMIRQHPYDGNGFDYDDELLKIGELGSHNGYLSILVQMGYFFGGAWLAVLLWSVLSVFKYATSTDLAVRRHVAIILAILFGAMHESYLTGVNQITTNLFFLSLMIVCYSIKHNKNAI